MSLFNVIKTAIAGEKHEPNSREIAQQRLRIMLINDRAGINTPNFLPQLQQEILEVLKKYVDIDSPDAVKFKYDNDDDTNMIEMSISFDPQESTKMQLRDSDK